MLVLACEDGDVPLVLKSFEALERNDHDHLFVHFARPFAGTAGPWLLHAAAHLDGQRGLAQSSEHSFPPLPSAARSLDAGPLAQLRALTEYLVALLPEPDDTLVLTLLPAELRDGASYYALIDALLTAPDPPPWLARVRLVLREDRTERPVSRIVGVRAVPYVLSLPLSLSTASMESALEEDAANSQLSPADRATALLQLAMMDYSHRRHAQAARRFRGLYGFFSTLPAPAMMSLCQQGMGDVLRATGQPEKALERYRSGLCEALDANAVPAVLNLLLAAAETCGQLRRWPEAQAYYAQAAALAKAVMNVPTHLQALLAEGYAWSRQQCSSEAVARWHEAETTAGAFQLWEAMEDALRRQRPLAEQASSSSTRLREIDTLLRTLSAPESRAAWWESRHGDAARSRAQHAASAQEASAP